MAAILPAFAKKGQVGSDDTLAPGSGAVETFRKALCCQKSSHRGTTDAQAVSNRVVTQALSAQVFHLFIERIALVSIPFALLIACRELPRRPLFSWLNSTNLQVLLRPALLLGIPLSLSRGKLFLHERQATAPAIQQFLYFLTHIFH